MDVFPYSSFVYSFSAATSFIFGVRSWFIYKKTGNQYSKMFSGLGLIITPSFLLWGLPLYFYPNDQRLAGTMYIIALIPYFIALNQPLKVALDAWKMPIYRNIAAWGVPIFALVFVYLHLQNIPASFVDEFGLIHWMVSFPYNIIAVVSGIFVAIIPAWFLFFATTDSRKAAVKKTLFGITFSFASISGWFLTGFAEIHIVALLILYTVFLVGFVCLALMMLVDIFMKEDQTTETQNQVYTSDH